MSEANLREHWTAKHKRHQLYKKKLLPLKKEFMKLQIPLSLTLVRIAARPLDDDNLTMAFKFIRDTLADWIIPGLAPGRADAFIEWKYDQRKGDKGEYAIEIIISSGRLL